MSKWSYENRLHDKPLVGNEYGAFRDTVQNLEPKEQKVRKAPIEHLEKM